jgi:Ca2+-binding RTX toxin-like protein
LATYAFTDPAYKWGDPVFGRPSGTITFGFDASFYSALSDDFGSIADYEVAAEFALETWASVAAIDFAPAGAGATPDLTIAFAALSGATIGQAFTEFTTLPGSSMGEVTYTVITLDSGEQWSPFGQSGLNFYNVVLHEAGHSLGLDHPEGAGSTEQVMYAFYQSDATLSLAAGDIEGIQLLYGPALAEILGSQFNDVIDRRAFGTGEAIYGFGGDDLIFGTQGNDMMSGGSGNDQVSGSGGADLIADMTGSGLLQGGDGDDRVFAGIGNSRLEGGTGDDVLVGGTGNDTLVGGPDRDLLQGDPADARVFGNDRLDGGAGNDLLMGGDGADVFVFRSAGGADIVGGFNVNWLDPTATTATFEDFTPGLDRIEFETGTFATAADVYAATQTVGGSAVITLPGGSASMTIFGVTEAELSADSFIFGGALA